MLPVQTSTAFYHHHYYYYQCLTDKIFWRYYRQGQVNLCQSSNTYQNRK